MPYLASFLSEPYTVANRISPSTELALSLLTSDTQHTSRRASPQPETTDAIVIVAADPDLRAYVRFGLETHGPAHLHLTEASYAAQVISQLPSAKPTLVVADLAPLHDQHELVSPCTAHDVPLLLLVGDDFYSSSDLPPQVSVLRTPFNGRVLWAHVRALLNR